MSNIHSVIGERAESEKAHRKELEAKFGGNIPLNFFNPIFIWATIDSLRNMRSINREAFDELVKKLINNKHEIPKDFIKKIEFHGTFLKVAGNSIEVDNLTKSLFYETEKRGGFIKFIEKRT